MVASTWLHANLSVVLGFLPIPPSLVFVALPHSETFLRCLNICLSSRTDFCATVIAMAKTDSPTPTTQPNELLISLLANSFSLPFQPSQWNVGILVFVFVLAFSFNPRVVGIHSLYNILYTCDYTDSSSFLPVAGVLFSFVRSPKLLWYFFKSLSRVALMTDIWYQPAITWPLGSSAAIAPCYYRLRHTVLICV